MAHSRIELFAEANVNLIIELGTDVMWIGVAGELIKGESEFFI